MDLASLEMMEMDDAIECLASAASIQRQLMAAKNTITNLQEELRLENKVLAATLEEVEALHRHEQDLGTQVKDLSVEIVRLRDALAEEQQCSDFLRGQLASNGATIDALASKLQLERDECVRLQEGLTLAKRQVPCTAAERPIGNYTFKHLMHTSPLEVKPNDAFAVTLVALAGHAGDWTCYMGRAGQRPAEIADHGDKILEHEVAIFAHVMQHRYYRN